MNIQCSIIAFLTEQAPIFYVAGTNNNFLISNILINLIISKTSDISVQTITSEQTDSRMFIVIWD